MYIDFQNVKSQLVEIVVPASTGLTQFKFGQQNFLRQKYIISIETFSLNDMPISPQGNGLPTTANLKNAFLTLYGNNPEAQDAQGIKSSGDGQWNENIPMIVLHRMQNSAVDPFVRAPFLMVPRKIMWEKSFVNLANTTTLGNGAQLSWVFNVGYIGNDGDNV